MTPFVGQIISVGFGFAPVGWLACDGSLQPINNPEYQVLYQLLGTTFGGNGTSTFGLPDLRGRVPLNSGQGQGLSPYVVGQVAGLESVTLLGQNLGAHTHTLAFSANPGTTNAPATGLSIGSNPQTQLDGIYGPGPGTVPLNSGIVTASPVGSQPHENRQPFQAVNYIIAYIGIYPSRP